MSTDSVILSNIEQKIVDLINQGQQPEAIKIANNYVEQQPDSSDAYYCRGQAKISWGHTSEAIDDLKKAIGINPSNANYYNMLGVAYTEKGEYEDAIQEFNRATHIEKDNLSYKANLSRANALLGNIGLALGQLEELYRLEPDNKQIKTYLIAVYISAATADWFYSEEDDIFYALSKEHIEIAEKYAKKVKYFAPSEQITIDRLQKLNEMIKQSKTRKFTGGWGTLIIVLLFSVIMFSTGSFLMGVTCILYYFTLRTPQYVSANLYFADKDGRSFGDRIASFFVTDGMVFFGPGVMGGFVGLLKANFIMSIIRLVVRISLLPLTVALGFFNNYSKNYAFIYIGSMVAFVVIMNIGNYSA